MEEYKEFCLRLAKEKVVATKSVPTKEELKQMVTDDRTLISYVATTGCTIKFGDAESLAEEILQKIKY